MDNADRQIVTVERALQPGEMDAMRPHPGKGSQELQRLHRLMRGRYLVAIILSIILAAGGAYLGFRCGGKTYQSIGMLRVKPVVQKILYPVEEHGVLPEFDAFVDAQVALIRSQEIMGLALDDPTLKNEILQRKADASLETFVNNMDVQRAGGLIIVKSIHTDSELARLSVDATMNAYLAKYKSRELEEQQDPQDRRQVIMNRKKGELDDLTRRLGVFSARYHTDDLRTLVQSIQTRFDDCRARLQEVTLAKQVAASRTVPRQASVAHMSDEAIAAVDQHMKDLLYAKTQAENMLSELRSRNYLDQHPAVITVRERLEKATNDVDHYGAEFRARPPADDFVPDSGTKGFDFTIAELTTLKGEIEQQLKEVGKDEIDAEDVKGKLAIVRQEYDEAAQKFNQWEVESLMKGRVESLSKAARPLSAYRDTRYSLAGVGSFGGVVVGFGSVLLIGLINRRLNRPDDADGGLHNFAMLGVLPTLPDDLADAEQAALASHCVHLIRTRLQIETQDIARPVFAVTSPVSGTGKTSLTLALGVSFAAARLKTLLVDCDLVGGGLTAKCDVIVRRKIGQILQREGLITEKQLNEALELAHGSRRRLGEILMDLGYLGESDLNQAVMTQDVEPIGILDALSGEDLEACVTSAGVDGLSVLPLGSATAQHVGRLAPDVLRRLVERCRASFDVVLIDTGPVPGSLEASVVASQVDEVILTVARGEHRALAEKSAAHLSALGARVAGIVFNRARNEDVDMYGSSNFLSQMPEDGGPLDREESPDDAAAARLGPIGDAVASSDQTSRGGPKAN